MNLRFWLLRQKKNEQVTFVVQKAVYDESIKGYTDEYRTTPIRTAGEWLDSTVADKYIVINADHPPIDVTGTWTARYKRGELACCVVTTEDELRKRYPNAEQAQQMIEWYEKTVTI